MFVFVYKGVFEFQRKSLQSVGNYSSLRFFSAFKTSKENCLKQILKTKDVKNIHYNEHILSYSFRIETLVFFTNFNSSYFYFETLDSI